MLRSKEASKGAEEWKKNMEPSSVTCGKFGTSCPVFSGFSRPVFLNYDPRCRMRYTMHRVPRMQLRGGSTRLKITWVQQRQYHRAHGSARERVLSLALSGGSTRLEITWVQQRQHHRTHESVRERMLSLALRGGSTSSRVRVLGKRRTQQ